MRIFVQLGLIGVLLTLAVASSAQETGVSFTPIGGPPAFLSVQGSGDISADGTTVVETLDTISPGAFPHDVAIWNAVDGWRFVPPDTGYGGYGTALSANGTTVVGRNGGENSGPFAFVWDADHGLRTIRDSNFLVQRTAATDVSADGSIVVGSGRFPCLQGSVDLCNVAFIWDAAGGLRGLGDYIPGPAGTYESYATAVSADGLIVVGRRWSVSALGEEAFVWDAGQGIQGLGDLSGGAYASRASDVSSDGSIVVGTSVSALGEEAFIWDAVQGMRGLGRLPGTLTSSALAVSDDGTIVGYSDDEVFVWDATHGMRSLRTIMSVAGLDITGWQSLRVQGISSNGKKVLGYGTNPSVRPEFFIIGFSGDGDDDGLIDIVDNCPSDINPSQLNTDHDESGDACDLFPNDPADDVDADLVSGASDNCPTVSNVAQADADLDGIGDECDTFPNSACSSAGANPRTTTGLAAHQDNSCENWALINQMGRYFRSAVLRMVDLSRAELGGTLLIDADLSGANLSRARLGNANLSFANLDSANCAQASFYASTLTGTSFSGADLTGADLVLSVLFGADLTGANLSSAILTQFNDASRNARLTGALYDAATVFPSGHTYDQPPWGLPAGVSPWAAGMVPVPEPSTELQFLVGLIGAAGGASFRKWRRDAAALASGAADRV